MGWSAHTANDPSCAEVPAWDRVLLILLLILLVLVLLVLLMVRFALALSLSRAQAHNPPIPVRLDIMDRLGMLAMDGAANPASTVASQISAV